MSRIIQLLCMLTSLFCACKKEVNLSLSDLHEPQLFIEGMLYVGDTPRIYVSSSMPFFNEKVLPGEVFVRDAEVFITEGAHQFPLRQDSVFDKFRCRWDPFYTGDFVVEADKEYQLILYHHGDTIRAGASTALKKPALGDVFYTPEFYDVYGGHDGVILRFRDMPGEGDYYRFQMDRWIDTSRHHAHVLDVLTNNCVDAGELFFVTDLGRSIFSDYKIDGTDFELYVEVSFEYRQGDTATVYLQNLDEQAARFYHDLDKQLESIRNPFVEPVFIHSTIDGAFGVFGAAIRSEPVTFVYPQDNP
ncbi:MAG: DUF4249 domain-containing protein [Saprospiraceae bacterium]